MEPQWNPMSEAQALDRIHRLGQPKEVTTTRYIMRGSWEEQVLKLQRRKQELADLTLDGGGNMCWGAGYPVVESLLSHVISRCRPGRLNRPFSGFYCIYSIIVYEIHQSHSGTVGNNMKKAISSQIFRLAGSKCPSSIPPGAKKRMNTVMISKKYVMPYASYS